MNNLETLQYCPGTLSEGYSSYTTACLRKMFYGKKVSHILPYDLPSTNEDVESLFIENRKRTSISGVQEKLSLTLEKNRLRLTKPGEQGLYILKPIPRDTKKVEQVPANEHLTMQIAYQVYGIETAENACIFFKDGTLAYITKRFDVKSDGTKRAVEDFATLAGKSKDTAGDNFKYNFSYEELGAVIKKYVAAWPVEIEKYFTLVLFNYIFSNGDAHLKNFSLIETDSGDFILTPAYDSLNTRLHVDDTDFALDKGLFADGYKSERYKIRNHPSYEDFKEFARRLGLVETRADKIIEVFKRKNQLVETLVSRSFLKDSEKRGYIMNYSLKRNFLIGK